MIERAALAHHHDDMLDRRGGVAIGPMVCGIGLYQSRHPGAAKCKTDQTDPGGDALQTERLIPNRMVHDPSPWLVIARPS